MKWLLVAAIVSAHCRSVICFKATKMKQAGEQSVTVHGFAKILQTITQRWLLILGVAGNAVSVFRVSWRWYRESR